MTAWVYILRCRDGRYYVGSTRGGLEQRVAEHDAGHFGGFTRSRRPVTLVYQQGFERITDAIAAERRLKGWSRAKKEALIRGDLDRLRLLAKRGAKGDQTTTDPHPEERAQRASRRMDAAHCHPSRQPFGLPQDEGGGGSASCAHVLVGASYR